LRTGVFTHAKDAKAGTGDTFYLPLSTWRPWREVLGFYHAKVANPTTSRSRGTSKGKG
jgi:hypothetical protein